MRGVGLDRGVGVNAARGVWLGVVFGVGDGKSSSSGVGSGEGVTLGLGFGVGVGIFTFAFEFIFELLLKLKLESIPRLVLTFVFWLAFERFAFALLMAERSFCKNQKPSAPMPSTKSVPKMVKATTSSVLVLGGA